MHDHHAHCNHHAALNKDSVGSNKTRVLTIALTLIAGFSLVELMAGRFSHSLALMADSGHLFSDCFGLGLALLATWMTRQPLLRGDRRLEVLAALINGISIVAIALWIGWEAVVRLQSPPDEILSLPMLVTASVGLGVNSFNVFLLHKDSHHDLNLKGAFLHVFADAVSSVGVVMAAIAIWALKWMWADGVISLLVSGVILITAVPLVMQSLNALWGEQQVVIED
ncbi:MAG: cation diffusion facilitator family transporter [Kastovskya adunca ATA6-11-RM4]|jgi:cobalt-zinc-cadmium efflux system protein|nr:cation diffusion facilitator family transporter [Kastovskya adunca ATA6-11-RM4]